MDRKGVIRKIVERDIRKLGLSTTNIQARAPTLYKAACKHFGDWPTALQYAGVSPNRAEEVYDDKRNVASCLRNRCITNRSIHAQAVRRAEYKLYKAALKHFGTWRAALMAAGININNVPARRRSPRYNREQIVEKIQERHAQNLPIRYTEVALEDWGLFRATITRFKSWKKALTAAGIELKDVYKAKKCTTSPCNNDVGQKIENQAKVFHSGKDRIQQLFLDRPGEVIAREEILVVCNSRHFRGRISDLRAEGMNIKFIKSENGFIFYPDDGDENRKNVVGD